MSVQVENKQEDVAEKSKVVLQASTCFEGCPLMDEQVRMSIVSQGDTTGIDLGSYFDGHLSYIDRFLSLCT